MEPYHLLAGQDSGRFLCPADVFFVGTGAASGPAEDTGREFWSA